MATRSQAPERHDERRLARRSSSALAKTAPIGAPRRSPGVIVWRMARNSSSPGPPLTLGYLSEQAVGIDAECHDCHHKVVLGIELFPERYGSIPFPEFGTLAEMPGLRIAQDRRAAGVADALTHRDRRRVITAVRLRVDDNLN